MKANKIKEQPKHEVKKATYPLRDIIMESNMPISACVQLLHMLDWYESNANDVLITKQEKQQNNATSKNSRSSKV